MAGVQIRRANMLQSAGGGTATHVNPFGVFYSGGGLVNSTATFLLDEGRTLVSVTRGDTRAGRAVLATVRPAAAATAGMRASRDSRPVPPHLTAAGSAASYFTGEGFDTCTAPSAATMQAWLASRYRAVNIYMGGSDRGCAQPNLTAGWVSTVVAQGWTLIPTYVGLQAPCWPKSGSKIDPSNAAAEGVASADDAANGMTALGLGPGNPVYFDMENYNTGDSGCVGAVEAFLDSWTAELHSRGYVSGVYSSASSGITNLVQETSNPSYHLPDDIWFADWNGSDSVQGDPYIPDSDWTSHQRIHQYAGGHNEAYGGVTLNIDNDAVDGATAPAALGSGSFVQVSGSPAIYEIAGGAPLYVSSWNAVGGPQPYTVISQAAFDTLNPVPANGTLIRSAQTGAIYVVAGGAPLYLTSCTDFGGCGGDVNVDQWDVANAGSAASHLNRRPANGTMIRSAQTGAIYVVAGGAPLYLTSCTDFGGCGGDVNVDQWDVANAGSAASHLNQRPANGTFIRGGARGTFYRVAGGYPFKLINCKVIGGCKHSVVVDPWDLSHLRNPLAHLRSTPRNGTIVRCYPSKKYWAFKDGKRHRAAASKRAVSVDDSSVTRFPL